jgi:hypothetical protein
VSKEDADFWGIPGSGMIKKAVGTFADVAGLAFEAHDKITAPDPYAVLGTTTEAVTAATTTVTGGAKAAGAADGGAAIAAHLANTPMTAEELAQIHMPPTAGSSTLAKVMPFLSLGAGGYNIYDGISKLASGTGPTLDAGLGIGSGVLDVGAGITGGAGVLTASGIGTGGAMLPWLASMASPVGIAAALAGFDVYGDKEVRERGWFQDDQGNDQSTYEEAADWTGAAYTGTHDYFADSWLGDYAGEGLGVLAGGTVGAVTAAGTYGAGTVANIGVGAAAATRDITRGIYGLVTGETPPPIRRGPMFSDTGVPMTQAPDTTPLPDRNQVLEQMEDPNGMFGDAVREDQQYRNTDPSIPMAM